MLVSGLSSSAPPVTTADIGGNVKDNASFEPIPGAQVYLDGAPRAVTDAKGDFLILDVTEGPHELSVKIDDYFREDKSCSVKTNKKLTVNFDLQWYGLFGFNYHANNFNMVDDTTNADILDMLDQRGIRILSVDICWWDFNSTNYSSDPGFAFYDWLFSSASEHNIAIVPTIGISFTPNWTWEMFDGEDECEQMNNRSEKIMDLTIPDLATTPWALNHSGVREEAEKFTKAVVQRYKDHRAFAGTWVLANEPVFPVNSSDPSMFFDYNPTTVESWREWAFERANPEHTIQYPDFKGGNLSLGPLLESWGFEPDFWPSWESIQPPTYPDDYSGDRNTSKNKYWGDWMEFRESHLLNFIRWHAATVREEDNASKIALKMNSWVPFKTSAAQAGFNYATIVGGLDDVDVFAVDFYPLNNDTKTLFRENELIMHFSALRALLDDDPSKELWIGEMGERGVAGDGTRMTNVSVKNMSDIAIEMGADKVILFTLDPWDPANPETGEQGTLAKEFSFYYNNVTSSAFEQVAAMNSDPAYRDQADEPLGAMPEVAVLLSLSDLYMSPWSFDRAANKFRDSVTVMYPKHLVCQALHEAGIPYVLLYENYLRFNEFPPYLKVLYMPFTTNISGVVATKIDNWVWGGGAVWADFLAGQYDLDSDSWNLDISYPMNNVFGSSFSGDPFEGENSIQIVDNTSVPSLDVGTNMTSLHDERPSPSGYLTVGTFTNDGSLAIWVHEHGQGKTMRVASALSVKSYIVNDWLQTAVPDFCALITDWADQHLSPNLPPTATIDAITPQLRTVGTLISFFGTGTDIDGTVVSYMWVSSISGVLSTSEDFSAYLPAGVHIVRFMVRDDDGAMSEDTASVRVTPQIEYVSVNDS